MKTKTIGLIVTALLLVGLGAGAQAPSADGMIWSKVDTSELGMSGPLTLLAAHSDTNVAATDGIRLIRFDGTSWTRDTGFDAFRTAVTFGTVRGMATDNNGYIHVVGDAGKYGYHNGTAWQTAAITGNPNLSRIWIDPATNRVVTGHNRETFYTLVPSGNNYVYSGSFATGFPAGTNVMTINGTSLNRVFAATNTVTHGLRAFSYNENTNTWALDLNISGPSNADLQANARILYALSDSYVIVGGGASTVGPPARAQIGFWDASNPGVVQPWPVALGQPWDGTTVLDIYATDQNSVWITGYNGEVAYFDGTAWNDIALPGATGQIRNISSSGSILWATGDDVGLYMAIPEPTAVTLLLIGGATAMVMRRRRRR